MYSNIAVYSWPVQLPLANLWKDFGIPVGTCIHAGANLCQERDEYQNAGFQQIIWIEALENIAFQAKDLLKNYNGQTVLQAVLWDTTGKEIPFHISSNNAESSSIFDFKWHEAIHPHISKNNQVLLKSKTLDDVILEFFLGKIPEISLLVLDLQGAEFEALLGSASVLMRTSAIHVEVSTVELYLGQKKMNDIVALLDDSGFTLVSHDLSKGVSSGDALFIAKHLVGDFKCMQMPEMRRFPILSFKQVVKYSLIRIGIPARLIQKMLFAIRKFMKNCGLSIHR
jgi:FkbM family methyltransferase